VAVLLLKNAKAIVSCDKQSNVYKNTDVLCVDGVIEKIDSAIDGSEYKNLETIDASKMIVYPGLINTHHHFFQTFVRNQKALDWAELSLVQWLERIYKIFTLVNEDCIHHSSVVTMAELIKHGCTTAFDHQYCFNDHAGSFLIDRQFEAARKTGIRFVAGRGTNTLPPEKGSTMPKQMVETTADYIRDCERIIKQFHSTDPYAMETVVLAPCQPINCELDTFTESLALARENQVSLHTHLSEGENSLMQSRWGKRSLDWCIDHGFYGSDVWIAHGWEMTRDELFRMAEIDLGLSHCAPAMCLVGDGTTNLHAAYKAGVRVGLGCDGAASNDNSNLLECVRLAYLLQSLINNERDDPMPPPFAFLEFATTGGASLLNRPNLGSLAVGQAADFFAIDTSDIDFVGADHDPALLPIKTGFGKPVDLTVINGEVVWQNGKFTKFDEVEAAHDAYSVFDRDIYQTSTMKQLRDL